MACEKCLKDSCICKHEGEHTCSRCGQACDSGNCPSCGDSCSVCSSCGGCSHCS